MSHSYVELRLDEESRKGKANNEHSENLDTVSKVTYLGYRIDKTWLHLLEDKAKAIKGAPAPMSVPELRMWEVRVTTSVPADFTHEKCTQFQLLTDRVRELELELDKLQIIREAD
eukprot:g31499.t1